MMTQYEAQKLKREMQSELEAEQSALWKCAVGILIIVGMSLFGAGPGERRDATSSMSTSTTQASNAGGR